MEFFSRMTKTLGSNDILRDLTEGNPEFADLGIAFISAENPYQADLLMNAIHQRVKTRHFMGCTCAGIIGSQEEIEGLPASSLILARLPGVKIMPFMMNQTRLEAMRQPEDWYNLFEIYPSEKPIFLILPDPFLFDMNRFLEDMNRVYPQCPIIGGLASGALRPGENTLILDKEKFSQGLVGFILSGNIRVETIVSQGCRPIGETFIVTKAHENIIYTLAGRPLMDVLKDVLKKASPEDQALAQEAVFVGVAMDEYKHSFKRGDFLIRGLMGIDQNSGAGAIADYVKTGQTVQFHVRDAKSARDDLEELLNLQQVKENNQKPSGVLVFCCNGRGQNLFQVKNHDIKILQKYIGAVPTAGFFCAGEIGPVGGNNFLHGFTSSIALFYPADLTFKTVRSLNNVVD